MRFFASTLALVALMMSLSLHAQEAADPLASPPAIQQEDPAPPQAKPAPRRNSMESLFERLSKAQDEDEAKGIANLIERRWARSGSDTADLLLNRANQAMESKEYPLAIELLDRVIVLQPKWAEAWNQRATVFYLLDDPVSAIADLYQALKLEPRQFNAWAGLGHIYMASDDKARALEAYRRALKINPKLPSLQMAVDRLGHEVDGLEL